MFECPLRPASRRFDLDRLRFLLVMIEGLAQLEAALKIAKPIQFKENVALVLKYYDKLVPFIQELRPAD